MEKVLQHFSMENAKAVSTPLPSHLKLTKEMCPKTQEEEDKMSKVPYASSIGSLMLKQPFLMVIWIKKYIWLSHRDLRSKVRRTQCAN